MLNFEEWYALHPEREFLDSLSLSDTDKKKITPVIVSAVFITELRKYFLEFITKKKRYIVLSFVRKEFTIFYKQRQLSILPFYDLERELSYLVSKVPECKKLVDNIIIKDYYSTLLKDELKFINKKAIDGLFDYVKVLHNDKVYGYKFSEDRPK